MFFSKVSPSSSKPLFNTKKAGTEVPAIYLAPRSERFSNSLRSRNSSGGCWRKRMKNCKNWKHRCWFDQYKLSFPPVSHSLTSICYLGEDLQGSPGILDMRCLITASVAASRSHFVPGLSNGAMSFVNCGSVRLFSMFSSNCARLTE